MKENKKKLPKWFKGALYNEGDIVENIFSGETYELNAVELSIYDFIMGAQMIMLPSDKTITDLHKALSWFKTNNAKAYMVLLD
tara:strand:- start:796 stop:1044 length:249 start_codon:yes stop_codon:yes gene_type:complete